MSMQQPLTSELEAKAQELLTHSAVADRGGLARLARLLVSKEDHEIFGETEFQARDIVHRIGRESLGDAPRSNHGYEGSGVPSARAANKRPNSTATAAKQPSV